MMPASLESLLNNAKQSPVKRSLALAAADDVSVIEAAVQALQMGLIYPVLFGKRDFIQRSLNELNGEISDIQIIDAPDSLTAVKLAVAEVKKGNIDILMKGLVTTKELLKEVIHKKRGLATNAILSHLGVFQIPGVDRLIGISDAAMNIAPTLEEKIEIIRNAVGFFNKLGNPNPKIALLAAISKVNPKMPDTVSAQEIVRLHSSNPLANCTIEGPMALDVAMSGDAAAQKGIVGGVAGNADLLVVPEITSGNILYKSLTSFAGAIPAGIILGATNPIILTSRSDSAKSKLFSIVLAHSFC